MDRPEPLPSPDVWVPPTTINQWKRYRLPMWLKNAVDANPHQFEYLRNYSFAIDQKTNSLLDSHMELVVALYLGIPWVKVEYL